MSGRRDGWKQAESVLDEGAARHRSKVARGRRRHHGTREAGIRGERSRAELDDSSAAAKAAEQGARQAGGEEGRDEEAEVREQEDGAQEDRRTEGRTHELVEEERHEKKHAEARDISAIAHDPSLSTTAASAPRRYWRHSRAHRYSLLFALPLLVLYEVLAAVLGYGESEVIRNGADVILKSAFIALLGRHGPLVFGALLIGVALWLTIRDMRRHGSHLQPGIFALMMGESILLALGFGIVVVSITSRLLAPFAVLVQSPMQQLDFATQVMVSLGAGLYEELLFRVLLVGAIAMIGTRVLGWSAVTAGVVAVGVGAFVFSAFHYIGPFGDPLEAGSFTFRLIAGVFFSALFVTRGFGITAWTHALYDVFLLLR
jgi:hypothetical protein